MLDESLKIEKREGNDYPPLPKNIYQVELLDVNSEQRPTYDTKNLPDHEKQYETVLKFQFVLLSGTDKGESLRGRNVWANFIPAYFYISKKNGENKTMRLVQSLLARGLNQQENAEGVTGRFINSLIGKQCRLAIEPKISGDKSFDDITDYFPAETLFNALTAEEKDKAKVKKNAEQSQELMPEPNFAPEPEYYEHKSIEEQKLDAIIAGQRL